MNQTNPELEKLRAAAKRRALEANPTPDELAALVRLLAVARQDTGQSKIVADFLLSWWNADTCGGFAIADLWWMDKDLVTDILTVIGMVARVRQYPPSLGLEEEFHQVGRKWRPKLFVE